MKHTKLLIGIWVTVIIWLFVVAGFWFGGIAATMPLSVMKLLVGVSGCCFLGALISFWLSPIYFAWRFRHRHLTGIIISTILAGLMPILVPVLIFWAYLPLENPLDK